MFKTRDDLRFPDISGEDTGYTLHQGKTYKLMELKTEEERKRNLWRLSSLSQNFLADSVPDCTVKKLIYLELRCTMTYAQTKTEPQYLQVHDGECETAPDCHQTETYRENR